MIVSASETTTGLGIVSSACFNRRFSIRSRFGFWRLDQLLLLGFCQLGHPVFRVISHDRLH